MSVVASRALDTAAAPAIPLLILNPKSFRASRGGLAVRATRLATSYGGRVAEVREPSELASVLDGLRAEGHPHATLLAGDGTVHAAVDHLARMPAAARPRLLLLPGGRSNLTANDLGSRGAALKTLDAAFRRWREGRPFAIEERATLAVEQDGASVRHGFFLAGGIADRVIRACHRSYANGASVIGNGDLRTFVTLATIAALAGLWRRPLPVPDLVVEAGNLGVPRHGVRLLVATTLHRHGLLNPYAERGKGALRMTGIAAGASGLWHRLPRLLLGRFSAGMNAESGYVSGRSERLVIHGCAGYTLDGEEFDADPMRPIVIRAGPTIAFLKP